MASSYWNTYFIFLCTGQSVVTNTIDVHVVVNFLSQLIFIFPLFLGMIMNANEFETKEIQKLTEIKN